MFLDPMYFVFMGPAIILTLIAQWKVQHAYGKYSKVPNQQRVYGAQAARYLLNSSGLHNVEVEMVPGNLTDHYDPRAKRLRLSQGVYNGASVASLGIVAHEVGHAVQDKVRYPAMALRAGLVPLANVGSYAGYIFFILGIVLGASGLVWIGVAAFSAGVLFALATLPVELNASKRARQMLMSTGLIDRTEHRQTGSVLNAAALTYVAALAMALLNLLYFVSLATGMGRRD